MRKVLGSEGNDNTKLDHAHFRAEVRFQRITVENTQYNLDEREQQKRKEIKKISSADTVLLICSAVMTL